MRNIIHKILRLSQQVKKIFSRILSPQKKQSKFRIIREVRASPIPANHQSESQKERFKNATKTRPKVCPVCRTSEDSKPGNIFRTSTQKWGCKACKHTWSN